MIKLNKQRLKTISKIYFNIFILIYMSIAIYYMFNINKLNYEVIPPGTNPIYYVAQNPQLTTITYKEYQTKKQYFNTWTTILFINLILYIYFDPNINDGIKKIQRRFKK